LRQLPPLQHRPLKKLWMIALACLAATTRPQTKNMMPPSVGPYGQEKSCSGKGRGDQREIRNENRPFDTLLGRSSTPRRSCRNRALPSLQGYPLRVSSCVCFDRSGRRLLRSAFNHRSAKGATSVGHIREQVVQKRAARKYALLVDDMMLRGER
jgi:hypothetical protein